MDAQIKRVNFNSLALGAMSVGKFADNMQHEIEKVFKEIDNLKSVWVGKQYDDFVTAINLTVNPYNDLFMNCVATIPYEIYLKAKRYATTNGAEIMSFTELTPIMLSPIELSNKPEELTFEGTAVEESRNKIENYFKNALNYAQQAINQVERLKEIWVSGAADANAAELKALLEESYAVQEMFLEKTDKFIKQAADAWARTEEDLKRVQAIESNAQKQLEEQMEAVEAETAKAKANSEVNWSGFMNS